MFYSAVLVRHFFRSGPRGRGPLRRWENQRMLSSSCWYLFNRPSFGELRRVCLDVFPVGKSTESEGTATQIQHQGVELKLETDTTTITTTQPLPLPQLLPFYGHYTKQPALAGNRS